MYCFTINVYWEIFEVQIFEDGSLRINFEDGSLVMIDNNELYIFHVVVK